MAAKIFATIALTIVCLLACVGIYTIVRFFINYKKSKKD